MKAPEPVVINGVLWKPYSVNHIDADGKKFSFYILQLAVSTPLVWLTIYEKRRGLVMR